MTGPSALLDLQGSLSGLRYPADRLLRLDPADDKPLFARYDPAAAARTLTAESLAGRRLGGLWRWRELLPVRDDRFVVTLGEGSTPLLRVPRLARALGLPGLLLKAESLNPTGSFKARGMAVAVSRAWELGATALIVPTAGNAGGALSAYAAQAGLPVTVVMPVDAPPGNQAEVTMTGGRLVLVEGLISDCGRVAAALGERSGDFDVSTLKEPYRVEGKKTMGLELAEDLAWRLPDVIVYPTGGGTGLVGMWKAFDELEQLGLLDGHRPRMVAAQTTGCAPIVRAFHAGERFADPWEGAQTRAAGLRVPSAVGDFLMLDALRASGGTAVAVDEDSIADLQRLAGRCGAGYVGPETAVALGAAVALRQAGDIEADERVVVFDCGIGAKYPPPPGLAPAPVIDPSAFDVEELAAALPR